MTTLTKSQLANIVLWAAYALALMASLNHVAWAFGTLEFAGQAWNGWLAALAVDAGLAALAYAIQQRRRAKRSVWTLWLGVVLFASISAFANVLHALTVQTGLEVTTATFGQVDVLALAKAIILSATLPLLVVYLGEVVSSDDAEASNLAEVEQKRRERREQRHAQTPVQIELAQPSDTAKNPVLDGINAAKQQSKAAALETLLDFLAEQPDASLAAAGQAIGRSKSTVGNYVSELAAAGRLKKNGHGWEVVG
jgi:hypothetical protein